MLRPYKVLVSETPQCDVSTGGYLRLARVSELISRFFSSMT